MNAVDHTENMLKFFTRSRSKKNNSSQQDIKDNTATHTQQHKLQSSDDDNIDQSMNIDFNELCIHDSDDNDTNTHKPSNNKLSVKPPSGHISTPSIDSAAPHKSSKLQQRILDEQRLYHENKQQEQQQQLPPYFTLDRINAINNKLAQYHTIHHNDIILYQQTIQSHIHSIQQKMNELQLCSQIVDLSQFDSLWVTTPQLQPEKRNIEKQRVFIHSIHTSLYRRGIGLNVQQESQCTENSVQCNERLILYCSLEPAALLKQNKITDFTLNCIVLTDKRLIQLTDGHILHECMYGVSSGNTVKVVRSKHNDDTHQLHGIQLTLQCKSQLIHDDNDNLSSTINKCDGKVKSTVIFEMPSIDVRDYLTGYIPLIHQLQHYQLSYRLSHNQSQYTIQQSHQSHIIHGWTVLLKSFAGPAIFSPMKLIMYKNLIQQACINTRELIMSNKTLNIHIKSIKLLDFYLPPIESSDLEDMDIVLDTDGLPRDRSTNQLLSDQIPELILRGWKFIPYYEYLFDYNWALQQFNATILITGKKLFKFKLQLTLSKLSMHGMCRLRTNPYQATEQISISFVTTPSINFCIESHMIVRSTTLPLSWQQKITKLIQDKIQSSITRLIEQQLSTNKWINITLSKSQLYQLLDKWYTVYKYPFMLDGTDDPDMMAYCLATTTQAEAELSETCNAMRALREKLTRFVNMNEPTADNA